MLRKLADLGLAYPVGVGRDDMRNGLLGSFSHFGSNGGHLVPVIATASILLPSSASEDALEAARLHRYVSVLLI